VIQTLIAPTLTVLSVVSASRVFNDLCFTFISTSSCSSFQTSMSVLRISIHVIQTLIVSTLMVPIAVHASRASPEME